MSDHAALKSDLLARIRGAADSEALEAIRLEALGKTGVISGLLKSLGAMSPEERKTQGPAINGLRDEIAAALASRREALEDAELDARLAAGRLDLTLPADVGASTPPCR
jgi:phenylalanyl-tRNA synthetase alpha chain